MPLPFIIFEGLDGFDPELEDGRFCLGDEDL